MPAFKRRQVDELRRAMQLLFRRFGALAADSTPCGKPLSMAHAHALMVLLKEGEMSQQELGRELSIDKSNVARLCARLVELDHATQSKSPLDGRSRLVALSPRGRRLALEVESASRARFSLLWHAIEPEVRPSVLDAFTHVLRALDRLPKGESAGQSQSSGSFAWSEA
jgi:DNA-binding MarR family transcriptional regulator